MTAQMNGNNLVITIPHNDPARQDLMTVLSNELSEFDLFLSDKAMELARAGSVAAIQALAGDFGPLVVTSSETVLTANKYSHSSWYRFVCVELAQTIGSGSLYNTLFAAARA